MCILKEELEAVVHRPERGHSDYLSQHASVLMMEANECAQPSACGE